MFLRLWHSKETKKKWPQTIFFELGISNVIYLTFVEQQKDSVLFCTYIKLGVMDNIENAVDKESDDFKYLKTVFSQLSYAKLKEAIWNKKVHWRFKEKHSDQ